VEPTESPRARDRRRTVLVVEDEPLIRMAMAQAVRKLGLCVVEACNAEEALDWIHSGVVPDALFTDIRMPGALDGLHLAALLEFYFPQIRVFLTSGHMAGSDLKLRMNFMTKPVDPQIAALEIKRSLSDPTPQ
jgi:DNA-binding NtrC family response regulator